MSKDGRFIPCKPLMQIFGNIKAIKDFQIIQKTKDKVLVKIVTGPGYSSDDTAFIKKSIQKLSGQDINIEVEFADLIPRTAGGKKRDFILEIPTKFVE